MKYTEIKKALNDLLKEKYPQIKIYGNEVKEGYKTPSFFTSFVSMPLTHTNKNFVKGGFTYKIVYFQDIKDEADQLDKLDGIHEVFDLAVTIGERTLLVKEIDYDYVGEKSDILEVNVKFEYMENRYKPEEAEIADEVRLNLEKQEG